MRIDKTLDHPIPFNQIEKLPKIDKYMMATTAIHKMGDISSDKPDLCRVSYESDNDYYGAWVTGFGFFNVRFPKETTRDLTPEEIEKYNSMHLQMSNGFSYKLKVD